MSAAYYAARARRQRGYEASMGRSDKYSPEQLKIALSIAKSEGAGVGARGRVNRYAQGSRALEIAQSLFEKDKPAAPAPAPQRPAPDPAPAPAPAPSPEVKINEESERLRAEAEEKLAQAEKELTAMKDEELQAQKAKELQQRLSIISSANLARSRMTPKLQIAPATSMPMIGGTAQFKRRSQSMFNSPVSNTLNV